MNPEWLRAIFWLSFSAYAFPTLLYLQRMPESIAAKQWGWLFANATLVVAFALLSYHSGKHAVHSIDEVNLEDTSSLTDAPANIAYGILALYFAGQLTFAHAPLYFVLAMTGYACLAARQDAGIYLVIAFYIYSFASSNLHGSVVYSYSKFVLLIYFCTYAYRHILTLKHKKKAQSN